MRPFRSGLAPGIGVPVRWGLTIGVVTVLGWHPAWLDRIASGWTVPSVVAENSRWFICPWVSGSLACVSIGAALPLQVSLGNASVHERLPAYWIRMAVASRVLFSAGPF